MDTFTGWVEAFPCSSGKAREVIKVLISEIIPRFGLPWTHQSDNGLVFLAEVTQGVSKALGIKYHLHCAWRPQSSGKVERANGLLKRHLSKLAQETHLPWQKLLPLTLIQLRNTPNKMGLTPFEAFYGRPFLQRDLILDPEVTNLVSHITQLAKFQQVLSEVGREEPQGLSPAAFCPGDLVLIKLPHNSRVSLNPLGKGHTRSCYLPPQE
jgi:hypothetical protein